MSFVEKMDVLDMIIETLKEHERILDDLVHRLNARLNGESIENISSPENEASLENWR
ncbi:MAG: hypothetical protein JSV18_07090 [Candidatus Bathyarchaeota archaeon]|nr:MAG: hypothetical protein JSV18_07090 [Candidatus Bathyarchaeota archaeon]